MHDTFEWWAYIWIPLALGATTVFVSVVALVASARATRIAHEVERQREAAAEERTADERRRRVQAMAIEEARVLTRWAMVAIERWYWAGDKVEETGEARHGPTLAHEARAVLGQSLVPGAKELLEVTEFEIDGFHQHKPDPMYMPDRRIRHAPSATASSEILSEQVPRYRRNRILSRIRDWALDPEVSQYEIASDLEQIHANPDAFMDYRRGIDVPGLPPLADLPDPPANSREAVEFFRGRGLLPPQEESAG